MAQTGEQRSYQCFHTRCCCTVNAPTCNAATRKDVMYWCHCAERPVGTQTAHFGNSGKLVASAAVNNPSAISSAWTLSKVNVVQMLLINVHHMTPLDGHLRTDFC